MSVSDGKTENERLAVVEQKIEQIGESVNQLSIDIREWQKNKVSKSDLDLMLGLRDQKLLEQSNEIRDLKNQLKAHIDEQKANRKSFAQGLPNIITTTIAVLATLWAAFEWASHLHG